MGFWRSGYKYDVSFSAKVKNLSQKDNLVHVVMPFPLQNNYQKLVGKYNVTPNGGIRTEPKFQNQYIYWSENLKSKEEKIFELKFKILVKPRIKPLKTKEQLSRFLKSDKFINAKKVLKISNDLTKKTDYIYEKVKILKILMNSINCKKKQQ